MAEFLVEKVSVVSALGLRERRKQPLWAEAVYYAVLQHGLVVLLTLNTDEPKKLTAYSVDITPERKYQPMDREVVLGDHTVGGNLRFKGPPNAQSSMIVGLYACTREATDSTSAQVLLQAISGTPMDAKSVLTTAAAIKQYQSLDRNLIRNAAACYATRKGQVFTCTIGEGGIITLTELLQGNSPPKKRYLRGAPSTVGSTQYKDSITSKGWRSIGPFDYVFTARPGLTTDEVRTILDLPGRHGTRIKKPPATR